MLDHGKSHIVVFIPAQEATRDLTVCWMPSLHREQETVSARGAKVVMMTVGAKPGRVFQANEATARLQAFISASCSSAPQVSSGG